jgi:hypothetical protein
LRHDGATGAEKPEAPAETGQTANCCCPAVLAALPVPPCRTQQLVFALPSDFPADARAPSRNLIPEPPTTEGLILRIRWINFG